MISGKWKYVHANDITSAPQLFVDAVNGKYREEKRWISREDFFAMKATDPYVRACWSFGNNCKDYLYSRKIEPYKKACHYAIVLDEWEQFEKLCPEVAQTCKDALRGVKDTKQRRLAFGPSIVRWLKANGNEEMLNNNPLYSSCHTKKDTPTRKKGTIRDLTSLESLECLECLESLERLQRLQRLESLECLQRLQRLQSLERDYRDVEFAEDSIIYCDPPYLGTGKERYYDLDFDYAAFYDWASTQTKPLFISEYNISDDRFVEYASVSKVCSMSATATTLKQEKIYIPRHQHEMIDELVNNQNIWDFK